MHVGDHRDLLSGGQGLLAQALWDLWDRLTLMLDDLDVLVVGGGGDWLVGGVLHRLTLDVGDRSGCRRLNALLGPASTAAEQRRGHGP